MPPQRLKRRKDWAARLHAALEEDRGKASVYGERDCCLSPCRWIAAMTDHDPAAEFRGDYTTATAAARVLKRYAGGGLKEAVTKAAADLRLEPCDPRFAKRGDVILIAAPEEGVGPFTLGLVDLSGAWVAKQSRHGVVFIDLRELIAAGAAVAAWSIAF